MQNNKNIAIDKVLDDILKDAANGYGDLMAAALIHDVSMDALQARVRMLRRWGTVWIS
jgi:hypothetical protein